MNSPQGEVAPMATTSQPKKETLELIKLFHQTRKMLPIQIYYEQADESVKLVLDSFADLNQVTKTLYAQSMIPKTSQPT